MERFLELANFYGRLVPKYAELCSGLHRLKKKDVPFHMTDQDVKDFENVKVALSSKPCVKPYDMNSHTVLRRDASENAISENAKCSYPEI